MTGSRLQLAPEPSTKGTTPTVAGKQTCGCATSTKVEGIECPTCRKKKLRGVQAKLRVDDSSDFLEREADLAAERWQAGQGENNASLHHVDAFAPATRAEVPAPDSVANTLNSAGTPLAPEVRGKMESHLGHDFSRVRVHVNETSADDIDARAYTSGSHVAFAPGEYAPGTSTGMRLIAHELAHVVQQSGLAGQPAVHRKKKPKAGAQPKRNFTVEKDRGIPGKFAIYFEHVQERENVLKLLFTNGRLPAGLALENEGVHIQGWKWVLKSTTAALSLEVAQAMTPEFLKFFKSATLGLEPDETAEYRRRETEFLNSRPIYLPGQTVREAMRECKDNRQAPGRTEHELRKGEDTPRPYCDCKPQRTSNEGCWGKRAGFFYYVGYQPGERSTVLEVRSSPNDPQIIKDYEWWLTKGYSLHDAAQCEEELQTNILKQVVFSFAGALSSAPGAVKRPTLPPSMGAQARKIATTGAEAYVAIQTARGKEISEKEMYVVGAVSILSGTSDLLSRKQTPKTNINFAPEPSHDPQPTSPAKTAGDSQSVAPAKPAGNLQRESTKPAPAGSKDPAYWQNATPDSSNKAANLKPGKAGVTDLNRFEKNKRTVAKVEAMQAHGSSEVANENAVIDQPQSAVAGAPQTTATKQGAKASGSAPKVGAVKPDVPGGSDGGLPTLAKRGRRGVLDPRARNRAAAGVAKADKDLATATTDIKSDTAEKHEALKKLKALQATKPPMPASIKQRMHQLEKMPEIEERLEALQEFRATRRAITADEEAFLNWREESWKLQKEIAEAADASAAVGRSTQTSQADRIRSSDALRSESKDVIEVMRSNGPNYRERGKVTRDELKSESQSADINKEAAAEGKPAPALATDHLVSLDRMSKLPELDELLSLYAKASPAVQDEIRKILKALGDRKGNLMRINLEFNNHVKKARSWEDITYAEAAEFGYTKKNVDAARLAEEASMRDILGEIDALTNRIRAKVNGSTSGTRQ